MIVTGIDAFGRVMVSRKDYEALTTEWNLEHGQPMNSGDLIVRDQWVAREAIARKACSHCGHPDYYEDHRCESEDLREPNTTDRSAF